MADIARLPTEIIALITTYSARDELKALRLTDHAFSAVATAKLFEQIHISPNSLSFDRAHQVAGQNRLTKHVRGIVYHFGRLREVYAGFDAFKGEYLAKRLSAVRAHDPYEITPEVLWSYNCWLEEIYSQRSFDLRYEAEELCGLCNQLPRLEAISTVLDEAKPFGDQEDYIGKRTGMPATEDDGWWRFPRLFAAAINKPLQKISARSIQWHDLGFMEEGSEKEIKASHDCLSRLKFLELGFYRSQNDFEHEYGDIADKVEYLHHIDLFDAMLGHTHQLNILKLDFDELPFESQADAMLPVSKTIFKHRWPRLKELKLEAICVYEDDLCSFLSLHQSTLRNLYIGDIELASSENEVPSILGMFTKLHKSLSLRRCKITGNFTNRVDQAWYVDIEHERPGCLRDQLERYICGTGSAAPDIELSEAGTAEKWQFGERPELWLHRIQGDFEAFQDDSWQWAPELLPEPLSPSH